MHVQNLMNSLWDIRIFLGLVPKESPCTNNPANISPHSKDQIVQTGQASTCQHSPSLVQHSSDVTKTPTSWNEKKKTPRRRTTWLRNDEGPSVKSILPPEHTVSHPSHDSQNLTFTYQKKIRTGREADLARSTYHTGLQIIVKNATASNYSCFQSTTW